MKSFKTIFLVTCLAALSIKSNAQEVVANPYTSSNKGKFFLYWGANRGFYSSSDIHFKGDDYNFTVHNTKAVDKPKGWHIDYINPTRMTIPQTNFRLGYYFTDKYSISFGFDHMKYVMVNGQEAFVDGTYPNKGNYGEVLENGNTKITDEFLQFEHTDGLNYVNLELARTEDISKFVGIYNTDKVQFNAIAGVGSGVLFPRTNAKVLGRERNDEFKVAGFGVSAKGGVNVTVFKHFFVQYETKVGYINILKTPVSNKPNEYAKHDFTFLESVFVVGGLFRL
ncbi:hypothetical protein H1R17_00485 [Flavobacterium sp. xlx-214]|uniref:hypothetical protein n=1 Tax=unclassified Flavobacterium TaxID=196869 RepID=UPI0013D7173E|nr:MULTISPECIES: hypothetical protein [unclassified Flavobacterium]MBA5791172.1 hypothetical protein [Flavobacterium sp. xlx-221]QMI83658.1 hypothetical protein H1R17_00485 [Flavobacterium sp. xlx-214]